MFSIQLIHPSLHLIQLIRYLLMGSKRCSSNGLFLWGFITCVNLELNKVIVSPLSSSSLIVYDIVLIALLNLSVFFQLLLI